MEDLISRAAAIEAFDDERVDRNYGDVSPESVIKVIESIPVVDAIPVNWISDYMNKAYGRVRAEIIREMLDAWMEQEGKDGNM